MGYTTRTDEWRKARSRGHGWTNQPLQARRAQAGWLSDDARAARGHDLRRIDACAVGAVTLEELQARVQTLEARLRDVEQEEQQLAASEEQRAQVAALAAQLDAFRATIAAGLDSAPFARRRELAESLIARVMVDPPEVESRYIVPFGGLCSERWHCDYAIKTPDVVARRHS